MRDRAGRLIDYLRISVTDRCNLRCTYCMPSEGILLKSHFQLLSLEEIYEVAKYAVSVGVSKIKITGGEPLVRKNIVHLVELLSSIAGLDDLGMTTNGTFLSKMAVELKDAGLMRINISLDTLDPQKFKSLTRGGDINEVFEGIYASLAVGMAPVKLNSVMLPGFNDDEKSELRNFADRHGLGIRFIPKMNLETGEFGVVEGGDGGKCHICNRLRLSADGKFRPCLFSDIEYDVRELGIEKAFAMALGNKPDEGRTSHNRKMVQLGG